MGRRSDLLDPDQFDYRLAAGASAIDAGIEIPPLDDVVLVPEAQYVHPRGSEPRPKAGAIDAGAYEYAP